MMFRSYRWLLVLAMLASIGLTASMGYAADASAPAPAAGAAAPFDILIRNGRVIDGTGAPWFNGDIGIRGGKIIAIGKLGAHAAKEVIDAKGSAVTPGFFDMHSHSDYSILRDGRGQSMVRQGITSETIGEGVSVAPRKPEMNGPRLNGEQGGVKPDWTTLRQYFARLQKQGVAFNVMSYISAGQLRDYVMGEGAQRRATPAELDQMKELMKQGMQDGAIGLVMALETPGYVQYAPEGEESMAMPTTDDLIALATVAGQYGGIYATHMRDQSGHIMEAINEAATIGDRAHVPVEIFHLKVSGAPYFGGMPKALAAIHDARLRGIDIAADVYPYTAASHGLNTEMPRWAAEGGRKKMLGRMADPTDKPKIAHEVAQYMNQKYLNEETGAQGFDAVIVANVPNNPEKYVGKTLGQIAHDEHKEADIATVDLFAEQGGDVSIVMFYMSEKDVRLALADPFTSVDTDGTAISPEFGGKPHPRYYGTFPRILGHYVRDLHLMPLEEAVRKMTSLPAQRLGIQDRGILRPGMWADVVVFDPEHVIDNATFDKPHAYPTGISHVIVNGVTVVRNGEHTGALPGRPLYGRGRKS